MKQKQNYIKTLYTSPGLSGAFSGVQRFMLSRGLKNIKNVKKELHKLDTYTKFRQARKRFPRLPVRINFAQFQFISDRLGMAGLSG